MAEVPASVKGMNDILPQDAALWEFFESTVKSMLRAYGYQQIRTPIVEPTQLFTRGIGEVTPDESMAVHLSPGSVVVRLHRVRYGQDEPLAMELVPVSMSLVPSFEPQPARTNAHKKAGRTRIGSVFLWDGRQAPTKGL